MTRNKNLFTKLGGFDLNLPNPTQITDPDLIKCYHLPDAILDNLPNALDVWARALQYSKFSPEQPAPLLSQEVSDALYQLRYVTECQNSQRDKQPIFAGISPLIVAAGAFALGFAAGNQFGKIYQLSLLGTEAFGILDVLGTPLLSPSRMPLFLPDIPPSEAFILPRAGVFFPPAQMWTNDIQLTFHGLRRLWDWGEDSDRYMDVQLHGMYDDRSAFVSAALPRYGTEDITLTFHFQFDQLLIPYQGSNGIVIEFPLFADPVTYPSFNYGYMPFGFTGVSVADWGQPLNP